MERLLIKLIAFAALAGGALLIGGELFGPKPLCRKENDAVIAAFKDARSAGDADAFRGASIQLLSRGLLNGLDREKIEALLGDADRWSKDTAATAGVYACGDLTFEVRLDETFIAGLVRRGEKTLASGTR